MNNRIVILVVLCLAGMCRASEFASTVVSTGGIFGPYPYNDPCAVLGEPTAWIYDDWDFNVFACSMVYGAWNVTPQNGKTVVTMGPNSFIVVGFDHKVLDEPDNPYGIDLIVFGNAAFTAQSAVEPNSYMDNLKISSPALIIGEKVRVEVAPYFGGPWLAFSRGPWGDDLFPTNRFAWDSVNKNWGQPLNPLKPVNPNLELSDFAGLTVSQAIALYDGSAGGTGFDLEWLKPEDYRQLPIDPQTGRRWIQYVRLRFVEGTTGGEVDAIADVAPADVPHFPAGDVNYDYRVDLQDLMILAQNWLVCKWNCVP